MASTFLIHSSPLQCLKMVPLSSMHCRLLPVASIFFNILALMLCIPSCIIFGFTKGQGCIHMVNSLLNPSVLTYSVELFVLFQKPFKVVVSSFQSGAMHTTSQLFASFRGSFSFFRILLPLSWLTEAKVVAVDRSIKVFSAILSQPSLKSPLVPIRHL